MSQDGGTQEQLGEWARSSGNAYFAHVAQTFWVQFLERRSQQHYRVLSGKHKIVTTASSQTPDELFGDAPDLDSGKAAEIAKDREKWKSLRPPKRC